MFPSSYSQLSHLLRAKLFKRKLTCSASTSSPQLIPHPLAMGPHSWPQLQQQPPPRFPCHTRWGLTGFSSIWNSFHFLLSCVHDPVPPHFPSNALETSAQSPFPWLTCSIPMLLWFPPSVPQPLPFSHCTLSLNDHTHSWDGCYLLSCESP